MINDESGKKFGCTENAGLENGRPENAELIIPECQKVENAGPNLG